MKTLTQADIAKITFAVLPAILVIQFGWSYWIAFFFSTIPVLLFIAIASFMQEVLASEEASDNQE